MKLYEILSIAILLQESECLIHSKKGKDIQPNELSKMYSSSIKLSTAKLFQR